MILLSQAVTPMVLLIEKVIWVNNSYKGPWYFFVIFLGLKLLFLLKLSLCLKENTCLLSYLRLVSWCSTCWHSCELYCWTWWQEKWSFSRCWWWLVRKLIYLTVTHLDITYTVSGVSQYTDAPHQTHYEAIFRILRYLKDALIPCWRNIIYKNEELEKS